MEFIFKNLAMIHNSRIGLLNVKIGIFWKMTRAFLIGISIPASYWVDVAYAAIYSISRLPTLILQDMSPFEVLFQKMPN